MDFLRENLVSVLLVIVALFVLYKCFMVEGFSRTLPCCQYGYDARTRRYGYKFNVPGGCRKC